MSSDQSSLVPVVALPPLLMINQNSPPNSLINVIQKIYNSFNGVISNNVCILILLIWIRFYVKCTNIHKDGIGWADFNLSTIVRVKFSDRFLRFYI